MPKEIEKNILSLLERMPEILIEKRKELGVTQQQLGNRINQSQQQINRYESSRYQSIKFEKIVAIALVLFTWEDEDY